MRMSVTQSPKECAKFMVNVELVIKWTRKKQNFEDLLERDYKANKYNKKALNISKKMSQKRFSVT